MDLKNLNTIIEKNNLEFERMSKAEKRVTIAEDCITRINIDQIKPKQGLFISQIDFYGRFNGFDEHCEMDYMSEYDNDVKEIINSSPITCSACVKGALFLSYVGRVNNVRKINNSVSILDSEHQKLLELFSSRQLAMIEYAFEGYQFLYVDENGNKIIFSDEELNKLTNFYLKNASNVEAMIAICENIIENKGEFIPATSLKL